MCSPNPKCGRPSRCSRIETSESNSRPRIFAGNGGPRFATDKHELVPGRGERDVDAAARGR